MQRRNSWGARTAAVAVVLVIAGWTQAAPASAHNWVGPTGGLHCAQNITDNDVQTYANAAADSRMWNALLWTRTNNIDPLDLTTQTVTSWTSITDVVAYTADWSGNTECTWTDPATGRQWLRPWCCEAPTFTTDTGTQIPFLAASAWCESTNTAHECEQHKLYFEVDNLNAQAWNTNYLHAIACHESGHTLGLQHVGGTCMTDPVVASQVGYSSDQQTHINLWFPEGSNP